MSWLGLGLGLGAGAGAEGLGWAGLGWAARCDGHAALGRLLCVASCRRVGRSDVKSSLAFGERKIAVKSELARLDGNEPKECMSAFSCSPMCAGTRLGTKMTVLLKQCAGMWQLRKKDHLRSDPCSFSRVNCRGSCRPQRRDESVRDPRGSESRSTQKDPKAS
jgi:hypothetical protein